MGRRRGRRSLTGAVVAVIALLVAARPGFAEVGTMRGAMEGDLRVNPGDIIRAGLSFTMPGAHPETTVQFDTAITFWGVVCVTGSGGGDILIAPGTDGLVGPYTVPSNDSSWFPTGDQSSPASYQGSVAAPDLCHGGTMSLRNGATFQADMQSNGSNTANVRFHYSANGSAGSWSATKTFTPSPLPASQVPMGTSGMFGIVAIVGVLFAAASRRNRLRLARPREDSDLRHPV